MDEEIWKDIPKFEGYYKVSNEGRVMSVERKVCRGNSLLAVHSRILSPNMNDNGYMCVSLMDKNGKRTYAKIHRLVALCFIPNPNNHPCINNKDENKTNNMFDNLEWCTYSYNLRYKEGFRRRAATRINTHIGKTVYRFSMNGVYIDSFPSLAAAGRAVGKERQGHIRQCCIGKRRSSYGYKWSYNKNTV